MVSGRFRIVSAHLGIDKIMAFHKTAARWVLVAPRDEAQFKRQAAGSDHGGVHRSACAPHPRDTGVRCSLPDVAELGTLGDLGGSFDASWNGLIYFSGINFATLEYTQIETSGPIRIINMMQALGGFMVLTWSATFLYSVCEQAWRE